MRRCAAFLISLLPFFTLGSRVIELNDSILETINRDAWLIKFYAPWCGYCRRLSPVYEKVAEELEVLGSPLKVAGLDASAYVQAGKHFHIAGFPTIMFINGSTSITYNGDRSVRSIVSFALRACAPSVKSINTRQEFEVNATYLNPDPFFILLDPCDTPIKGVYESAAEKFRFLTWFFRASAEAFPPRYSHLLDLARRPNRGLIVFKDSDGFVYPGTEDSGLKNPTEEQFKHHVMDWILRERYPAFPEMKVSDLWEFGSTELSANSLPQSNPSASTPTPLPTGSAFPYRLIALYLVTNYHDDALSGRFLQHGRMLAQKRLPSLFKRYQLAWTDEVALLSELAMIDLFVPSLIVVDPITRLIYLNPNQTYLNGLFSFDENVVVNFLLAVSEGQLKGYGGNTIPVRLRRLFYNLVRDVSEFVMHNPIISFAIFAVPALLFSCVVYLCCCMDTQYDEDMDEELIRKIRPQPREFDESTEVTDVAAESSPDMDVRHRGNSNTGKHYVKEYKDAGPVRSKSEIEAKHAEFEKWKNAH
ncbi:unnamed protein product [Calicophoron daubneyi]|uniref:Thioredoxin domain-containing protein n=1 Tax=Calicophoron daubneyi TaxID=300641 RepID=A0AAV2TLA5_CALDB